MNPAAPHRWSTIGAETPFAAPPGEEGGPPGAPLEAVTAYERALKHVEHQLLLGARRHSGQVIEMERRRSAIDMRRHLSQRYRSASVAVQRVTSVLSGATDRPDSLFVDTTKRPRTKSSGPALRTATSGRGEVFAKPSARPMPLTRVATDAKTAAAPTARARLQSVGVQAPGSPNQKAGAMVDVPVASDLSRSIDSCRRLLEKQRRVLQQDRTVVLDTLRQPQPLPNLHATNDAVTTVPPRFGSAPTLDYDYRPPRTAFPPVMRPGIAKDVSSYVSYIRPLPKPRPWVAPHAVYGAEVTPLTTVSCAVTPVSSFSIFVPEYVVRRFERMCLLRRCWRTMKLRCERSVVSTFRAAWSARRALTHWSHRYKERQACAVFEEEATLRRAWVMVVHKYNARCQAKQARMDLLHLGKRKYFLRWMKAFAVEQAVQTRLAQRGLVSQRRLFARWNREGRMRRASRRSLLVTAWLTWRRQLKRATT